MELSSLTLPNLNERVVNSQGTPWPRVTEPLRFEMAQAEGDDGDYRLRLVRADGSAPPAVWLTVSGQPTLYLACARACPLLPSNASPSQQPRTSW